jgi:hypothetical protein
LVTRQVLFHQPTSQGVGHLAGPILPFGERDQTVLAILAKHLIKGLCGLDLKLFPQLLKLCLGLHPRHG